MSREFLDKYGLAGTTPERATHELATAFEIAAPPKELVIDFSIPKLEVAGRAITASRSGST